MREKLAICSLLFGAMLYAQPDAINVTATQTVDLPPEEVTFNLAVITEQDTTLDQVLTAVKDTGLATKDLTGISTQQYGPGPSQTHLAYQFAMTAPFAKFKETLDKLGAARRSLLASGSSMEIQTYFLAISATDAAREQARQRALPALIEDARKKGDALAKAAGLSLGPIEGIADSFSASASTGGFFGPFGPFGPTSLKTTFVLSVRFSIQ